MTQDEMRKEYYALYNMMANSNNIAYMHVFGQVQKEVMEWAIANKPDLAQDWLDKLESIKWKNYLTPKEAQKIIDNMNPKAPWTKEQWKSAMEHEEYDLEDEPHYNACALYVAMCMIMSDSGNTLKKYVSEENLFDAVYELAVDKLTDKDGVFSIRRYFSL
ncbi:hypothetical protein [Prevotella sp. E2-28]|uniref:DUF7841 family protein n=1 Tax=Prevotella sp. E2-28 TaxID=2913620 RepID=UPI001EDA8566|nr:hypothetical protein [Prevotella sp. E2-28]UKK52679.1 hypothetical protein L6465_08685 [Prevotella sp. E2-28]